jgi:hypothetical protein
MHVYCVMYFNMTKNGESNYTTTCKEAMSPPPTTLAYRLDVSSTKASLYFQSSRSIKPCRVHCYLNNHVWSSFSSFSQNLIFTQLWLRHTKPLLRHFVHCLCPLLRNSLSKPQASSYLLHRLWELWPPIDQINVHLNPKPPIDPIVPKP